jgi:DNA-binding IclR family transcriptional regulator
VPVLASNATGDAAPGTEAAARVADVLMLFTSGAESLGVSAVARELGLSKAVVHRILWTLADRSLISPDPVSRGYRLGPGSAALGARALRGSSLRTTAAPLIEALQQSTGETTTVSSLVPGGRVYLAQVESPQQIRMTVEIGRKFPLHAGSSGKVILAFMSTERRQEVFASGLEPLTSNTVVDVAALNSELAEVRRSGLASSRGERQSDAGSVAAPVFGLDGDVVGAISVCGPIGRVDEHACDRFAPALAAAADEISRGLGWSGGLPELAR